MKKLKLISFLDILNHQKMLEKKISLQSNFINDHNELVKSKKLTHGAFWNLTQTEKQSYVVESELINEHTILLTCLIPGEITKDED